MQTINELKAYLDAKENNDIHPSELVKVLKELDEYNFADAIQLIPKEFIGDIALSLPDRYFGDIIESLELEDLTEAVMELESDDQTDFMQELHEHDEQVASKLFETLDKEDQVDIIKLKNYEESEAGSYMQTEVFTAHRDERVQDVVNNFAQLKKSHQLENVHTLFITKRNNELWYSIALEDLLIFDFSKTLRENITNSTESFKPKVAHDREDIKEVVHYFEEYDLTVIPVVDRHNILLGRITSDDIYDIINEHATEQMYHLAGVDDEAEEDEEILKAGKKRASWLGVNLVTAILASLIISLFSETIESIVALAILMPIVASMGGNAGTQTLTVVVRQLALGDISQNDATRIIKKELGISFLNGLLFAIIMGIVASFWFEKGLLLGVVIALSMLINLIMAGLFGATIPLFLKKMNVDPAIGSTVILTTVTDIVGFFSFLGLATIILL